MTPDAQPIGRLSLSSLGSGGRRKAPPGSGHRTHPAAPVALCHSIRSSLCLVEQKVHLHCTVHTLGHVAFAWGCVEGTLSTLSGLPWWLLFCLSNQWSRRWLLQFCFSVPSDRKQPAQRVHAQVWAPCTLSMLWWILSSILLVVHSALSAMCAKQCTLIYLFEVFLNVGSRPGLRIHHHSEESAYRRRLPALPLAPVPRRSWSQAAAGPRDTLCTRAVQLIEF